MSETNRVVLCPLLIQGAWPHVPPAMIQSPQIDVETLQEHFHLPITGTWLSCKAVSCLALIASSVLVLTCACLSRVPLNRSRKETRCLRDSFEKDMQKVRLTLAQTVGFRVVLLVSPFGLYAMFVNFFADRRCFVLYLGMESPAGRIARSRAWTRLSRSWRRRRARILNSNRKLMKSW